MLQAVFLMEIMFQDFDIHSQPLILIPHHQGESRATTIFFPIAKKYCINILVTTN